MTALFLPENGNVPRLYREIQIERKARVQMKPLPDSVKQLIEGKVYANVATIMPDGSPHVVMTWVDHDGDTILINTIEGSQKHRNVMRNEKIALDVVDPTNSYNVAFIRGRVKEVTFDGAEDHIDKMAKKYMGQEKYPMHGPDKRRVLLKIEATRVIPPFTDTSHRKWLEGKKMHTASS